MNKNVVVLIRNATPYDFGGGERVPVFIGREALRSGRIQPIIFSRSKKLLEFAAANNVPYRKTWWWSRQNWSGAKVLLTPIYFLWQMVLFFYYVALFIKYRPVVVHIQSKDDFIAGTYAARLVGATVIWSDHADLKHIFKNHKVWYKNPIGKAVYLAASFVDKIVIVSEEDRRLISKQIQEGRVMDKMEIIYNGAFDSHDAIEKNKPFTFVSTGRLVTDKGIGELIDAFKKFNKQHPDSQLILLGDGPERSKFEAQSGGRSSILFLGYKQDPLVYVAKSHVFLLPTYHEGFSLALVEACMLGMPVIATDVGGNPEIIRDRDTGLLVSAKDSSALLKAMGLLYTDSALRNKLAKNARKEFVAKFNFEKIIQKNYINYYEEKGERSN
jgi:glycosyltransferase involved in cell wall biosynthesis